MCIRDRYPPLYEESIDELKNEQLSLYASVPPWEYMMHHTVTSLDQSVCNNIDSRIDVRSTTRLKYLISSVEKLLNEFKDLVNSTCCASSKENDGAEDENCTATEDNCIVFSDIMSFLIGIDNNLSSMLLIFVFW